MSLLPCGFNLKVAVAVFSGGSDKGGGGGGGGGGGSPPPPKKRGGGGVVHPDLEIYGGGSSLKKIFFSALGASAEEVRQESQASVWSKSKGPGFSPGSTTGIVPDITFRSHKQTCMYSSFASYGSESNDNPLKEVAEK